MLVFYLLGSHKVAAEVKYLVSIFHHSRVFGFKISLKNIFNDRLSFLAQYKTVNICLNTLEMLFDTGMIMYLCNHHEHLHAWYRDPRYEHVPSLLLESSERMKVE